MKTLVGILGIAAAIMITGCEVQRTVYLEDLPPTRPTGVTSITGDRAVYLYWNPNGERDLDFYRVYRGPESTGRFDFIGSTGSESFVDDFSEESNGITINYHLSGMTRLDERFYLAWYTIQSPLFDELLREMKSLLILLECD